MKIERHLPFMRNIAESIVEQLRPNCKRVEIAGSIRRTNQTVGDIEIVAIPKIIPDIFGISDPSSVSLVDMWLDFLPLHI